MIAKDQLLSKVELQTPCEQTSLLNAEKFWFYQAGLEQGCSMFVSYTFLPCKHDGNYSKRVLRL